MHLFLSHAPLRGTLAQKRKLTLPSWKSGPLIATHVIRQLVVLKQAASAAQGSCNLLLASDGETTLRKGPTNLDADKLQERKLLDTREK